MLSNQQATSIESELKAPKILASFMARHKWIARCKYRLIDIDFRGGIKIKLIIIFSRRSLFEIRRQTKTMRKRKRSSTNRLLSKWQTNQHRASYGWSSLKPPEQYFLLSFENQATTPVCLLHLIVKSLLIFLIPRFQFRFAIRKWLYGFFRQTFVIAHLTLRTRLMWKKKLLLNKQARTNFGRKFLRLLWLRNVQEVGWILRTHFASLKKII